MRIVFCGTPASAVPSLEAVAARASGWETAAVLTRPDRPAGRGRRSLPSPVRRAAERLGLRVLTPERPRDVRGELEALRPDVIAVVAYGHIFRRWLLELPRLGCLNVHFSLLPRHRGVAPVAWAILRGDRETGVTTMRMDRGVDTGPLYLSERVVISEEETAGSLTERLAPLGARLLVRTLEGLAAGELAAVPQDDAEATYAPRLTKEDGLVDWTRPAEEVDRRVRGLAPWPGAFTIWRGRILKLHRVRVLPGRWPPGSVRAREGRPEVGTGHGIVELVEVQPEGKARMEGRAWLRGVRLRDGEELGGRP